MHTWPVMPLSRKVEPPWGIPFIEAAKVRSSTVTQMALGVQHQRPPKIERRISVSSRVRGTTSAWLPWEKA